MDSKKPFTIVFFMTALFMGLAAVLFADNGEGRPPVSKIEGMPSPPVEGRGVSIRFLWTVSGYRAGERALRDTEEARALLFKPLDIGATTITFNGRTCRNVIFTTETVQAKDYLDHEFHATPQALGIEDETMELVRTTCDLPGFSRYLRLKNRRIVIHINGIFFFLDPAVNY